MEKMTVILHSPPQLPSHSSTSITCISPSSTNDVSPQHTNFLNNESFSSLINLNPVALYRRRIREAGDEQLSVLEVLVTIFRKSLVGCRTISGVEEKKLMEIGWPTNVRHVAHVTFDRFNGFLGLPAEFEPEVPRKPPSASTRVFGVSTESMQLSFDSRGNCVPTILLMMQRRLYLQGGLQSEGIFRINAENGQEEYVREQLNNGLIPENIDVHCLAGLIKAWFRELPKGVLDPLAPEQVMQAQSEDNCTHLVRLLPPTESALLDWAINLMADVAQFEHHNKMNARNIAMVFAPNMTQMSDPLTALMYAVQVMNFLKTLITKTLRQREDNIVEADPVVKPEPSDKDGHHRSILKLINLDARDVSEEEQVKSNEAEPERNNFVSFMENMLPNEEENQDDIPCGTVKDILENSGKTKSKNRRKKKGSRKHTQNESTNAEITKESSIVRRVNSETERTEAWR